MDASGVEPVSRCFTLVLTSVDTNLAPFTLVNDRLTTMLLKESNGCRQAFV